MKPPDTRRDHIVAAAALGAITEARWRSCDAVSRRSAAAAPDLLRGLAGELAFSPIGRDQLLSAALLEAADDLERGRAPRPDSGAALAGPGPSEAARAELRRDILACGLFPEGEARHVPAELEARHRPECRDERDLSARLEADASLHQALWDDPRLACDVRTRGVMRASIPQLRARAAELAASRIGPAVPVALPNRPPGARGLAERFVVALRPRPA